MRDFLPTLVSPGFLLLYAFLGCVLYVHFRGKERLRFERQLTEHSGLLSPLNCIFYAFSSVPKDPILDPADFPELAPLKENWETIRDEAVALMGEGKIAYDKGSSDLAFLAFQKRGWKRFYLRWYHDYFPSAVESCPKTVELTRSIPGLNAAAFTMLPPGGVLGKHRDPLASSLRYHLALVTPTQPGCKLWVDGQEHEWQAGQDLVFDETYVHWAENPTDENRIVFFADFTRPIGNRVVRAFNQFLIDHVYRVTRSRNDAGESAGMLNRITPIFVGGKKFFRGIKERSNRRLYYTVKYSLFGTLLWFVVVRPMVMG